MQTRRAANFPAGRWSEGCCLTGVVGMDGHLPLVLIGEAPAVRPSLPLPLSIFADWDAFVASNSTAAGFLIFEPEAATVSLLAETLRRSQWWASVAYTPPGMPASPLLDGEADFATAADRALRSDARRQTLNLPLDALEGEERLLAFLYLRDDARLVPVLAPSHPMLYRYPLAEAVAGGRAEAHDWLPGLVRRQLLEPENLVNRVRHCPACASAHLLFVDVCPQCASIQISRTELLHCFTCGHVAEEASYLSEGGMRCPNCHTTLRHIGVDYDRPLARYRCGSCHHLFAEANVTAECLNCSTTHAPSDLDVRDVSVLRLSPRGRAALRAGAIAESFAALESANYVLPAYFQHMLGWMLQTAKRHTEFHFGLVRVEFLNVPDILEAVGPMRSYLLLDEFARRLREILRASDVTTRTVEDHLLMLLPFSPPEGVVKKVHQFLQHAADEEVALAARLTQLACPRDVSPSEVPDQLLNLV